jgi:hypothetical protein
MKKRAFVRYSKQGKIVPGSLILTSGSFPSGPSTWKEVPADLCCETVTISAQVNDPAINAVSISFLCNGVNKISKYSTQESTDTDSLVAILNEEFGPEYGTFTYLTDGLFTLDIKASIANELCPNGFLSFEIFSD